MAKQSGLDFVEHVGMAVMAEHTHSQANGASMTQPSPTDMLHSSTDILFLIFVTPKDHPDHCYLQPQSSLNHCTMALSIEIEDFQVFQSKCLVFAQF